jgi:hypothetical protein
MTLTLYTIYRFFTNLDIMSISIYSNLRIINYGSAIHEQGPTNPRSSSMVLS